MTQKNPTTAFDPTLGAIHDLTIASEFLMVALRAITATQRVNDRQAQEAISLTLRKLRPLMVA
ncbi:hypothetical protein [Fuscibacter oryzae]|uniref:Uncharacterized protein n=1 Tax=Fuscibacter oryzae TaxID=2803939 RepID=A0A8J7MQW7_9RHOB|nr:hypothetical protein [Fuscibacter oryzae]MBL4927937.1 hypothetical protein [Fuscibacter oryzae]